MDISDISTTKENFPELNPKGLPQMLPPEVRLEHVDTIYEIDVIFLFRVWLGQHLFASTMDMYGITNDDHVSL